MALQPADELVGAPQQTSDRVPAAVVRNGAREPRHCGDPTTRRLASQHKVITTKLDLNLPVGDAAEMSHDLDVLRDRISKTGLTHAEIGRRVAAKLGKHYKAPDAAVSAFLSRRRKVNPLMVRAYAEVLDEAQPREATVAHLSDASRATFADAVRLMAQCDQEQIEKVYDYLSLLTGHAQRR